jgi:hypothetical protein
MNELYNTAVNTKNHPPKKPLNKSLEESIKKNIIKNTRRLKKKKNHDKEEINISGVTVISVADNNAHLEEIIENYDRQNYTNRELVVSLRYDADDIEELVSKDKLHNSITLIKSSINKKISKCLNDAVTQSKYNIVAIFDINTFYGSNYLSELASLYRAEDAYVIGKAKYYVYLKNNGILAVLKKGTENNYVDYVYGPTLSFRKEVMDEIEFIESEIGVEKQFYINCLKKGFKIYSSDRNSFVSIKTKGWKQLQGDEFSQNFTIVARNSDYTGI